MTFVTHAYYILFAWGWGYLLANWKWSFPWITLLTLLDFLIIQCADNAIDIWLYRYVPAVISWLSGAILSQYVIRIKPFKFDGYKGDELLPVMIFIEGIIYSLTILLVVTCITIPYTVLLLVTCGIFIWMAYNFSLYTGRFGNKNDSYLFYLYWFIFLFLFNILPYIIISIAVDNMDQNALVYFYCAIGIAGFNLVATIFVELIARGRENSKSINNDGNKV